MVKKQKPKISPKQNLIQTIPTSIKIKVGIAFGSLTLLRIIAAFLPEERLWGLNHFAFLPLWFTIVVCVLSFLFCTPIFYSSFVKFSSKIFNDQNDKKSKFFPIIFGVAGLIIFWSLKMNTIFLGDGATYLAELYRLSNHLSFSHEVLYSTGSAPLTGFVHATMRILIDNTFLRDVYPWTNTRISFWITGFVLGVIFILASYYSAKKISKNNSDRLWIFLSMLSSAGLIFYFGYIEYYTFVFTALAIYFFFCIRAIENKIGLIPLVAMFIISVASHLMSLIALPSLLLIILYRSRSLKIQSFLKLKYILLALLCIMFGSGIFYFASGIFANGSRTIISLLPFGKDVTLQRYTLLSSYHLIDFINLLFLYSAPTIVALFFILRNKYFTYQDVIVTGVNVFFFSCLAFFGYSCFGLARDWDINAALGLALLFFLITIVKHSDESPVRKYVLYAATGAALCSALPWIAVNIDDASAVQRFRSVIALDAAHIPGDFALNGYEHLCKWYISAHDARSELWAIQKKIEYVGYPSDYRDYSNLLLSEIPFGEKRSCYDWLFEKIFTHLHNLNQQSLDSSYQGRRDQFEEIVAENIIQCLFQSEQEGLGREYARDRLGQAEKIISKNPVLDIARAEIEMKFDSSAKPHEKLLRGGMAVRTSPSLCIYAGKGLILFDDLLNAKPILEKGYKIDSTATYILFQLAYIEAQTGNDYQKIRMYLEKFLADPKTYKMRQGSSTEKLSVEVAEKMLAKVRAGK